MNRRDNNPRIWEASDYKGSFSICPQGVYDGVLVIAEPGLDDDSNVCVISPDDVVSYLDGERSGIVNHGFVVPTVDFQAGTVTVPNGTPQGLQMVVTYAFYIASEFKKRYYDDRSYLVKSAKVGDFYVAMIHFGFGVTDNQIHNIAGSVGIIEHTRYFHVKLLHDRDFPRDYLFEPPHYDDESEDDEDATMEGGPTNDDNPQEAEVV